MPTFHGSYTSPLGMMEEESQKVAEINYYRRRLNECKAIELLSLRDQNILFDLYFFGMNQWDVAAKYGYSRRGMMKHIRAEIAKLM